VIILETLNLNLSTAAAHLSSFNELGTAYQILVSRQRILTHNLFTKSALRTACEQVKSPNGTRSFSHWTGELFTAPDGWAWQR
jgi:hypothetical protein